LHGETPFQALGGTWFQGVALCDKPLSGPASFQFELFFNIFDKSGCQFFGWMPRQMTPISLVVELYVSRAILKFDTLLLQPLNKLTLFHYTSLCCYDKRILIKKD
jgi:hypothetical protein